jgi:hypothetical protein
MINIEIKQLEQILLQTIEKLHSANVETIEIDFDNYWIILSNDWNDFDNEIAPAVGSLKDDWDCLLKTINNKDRAFSYLDVDRLASILRAISQKQVPI